MITISIILMTVVALLFIALRLITAGGVLIIDVGAGAGFIYLLVLIGKLLF